jgi:hypothetical protein
MTTWELIQQFGLPLGMLIIALITGARGDWVFGREYRDMRERNAKLEARVDRLTQIAERGTRTTERVVDVVERRTT